jgi:hypothetical protein
MQAKKVSKKPSFAIMGNDDPSIKGVYPPSVDSDPGHDPCDDEISVSNPKNKKITNIIHYH